MEQTPNQISNIKSISGCQQGQDHGQEVISMVCIDQTCSQYLKPMCPLCIEDNSHQTEGKHKEKSIRRFLQEIQNLTDKLKNQDQQKINNIEQDKETNQQDILRQQAKEFKILSNITEKISDNFDDQSKKYLESQSFDTEKLKSIIQNIQQSNNAQDLSYNLQQIKDYLRVLPQGKVCLETDKEQREKHYTQLCNEISEDFNTIKEQVQQIDNISSGQYNTNIQSSGGLSNSLFDLIYEQLKIQSIDKPENREEMEGLTKQFQNDKIQLINSENEFNLTPVLKKCQQIMSLLINVNIPKYIYEQGFFKTFEDKNESIDQIEFKTILEIIGQSVKIYENQISAKLQFIFSSYDLKRKQWEQFLKPIFYKFSNGSDEIALIEQDKFFNITKEVFNKISRGQKFSDFQFQENLEEDIKYALEDLYEEAQSKNVKEIDLEENIKKNSFVHFQTIVDIFSKNESIQDLQTVVQKPKMSILLLGLEASGKTTLLYKLKIHNIVTTIPTIGFNIESINEGGKQIDIWDVGGQEKIRPLWVHYFAEKDYLLYMVDASDHEMIPQAYKSLESIVNNEQMKNVPFLILANKSDLEGALNIEQIKDLMNLDQLFSNHGQKYEVISMSVINHQGIDELLKILSNRRRRR